MHKNVLSLLLVFCTIAISMAAESSPIRINQIGYETNGPKKAIYQASSSKTLASKFTIHNNSGTEVYSGNIVEAGAVDGWKNMYFWELDFSAFTDAGEYTIKVGNDESFSFKIGESLLYKTCMSKLLSCFKQMRNTDEGDRDLPLAESSETIDLYGGYNEASGDESKHITHLQYSNYMCGQETPGLPWSLLRAYEMNPEAFDDTLNLKSELDKEVAWGCDYLMRSLSSEGFFYSTVFNGWGILPRTVCAYEVIDITNDVLELTKNYQTAFREGGGLSIAALAKASAFGISSSDYSAEQYLAGAIKAYDHIKENNTKYCDNGTQNILDEYSALVAAIELYKATDESKYKEDAKEWATAILSRETEEGWLACDDGKTRPYYHAAEEGLPVISLIYYMEIDNSLNGEIKAFVQNFVDWYFELATEVTNPFQYPRMYALNFDDGSNLCSDASISAGTFETDDEKPGVWDPESAIDGNKGTYWMSKVKSEGDEEEWVTIDLGETHTIKKMFIDWEWQYASEYKVQVSDDDVNWTVVCDTSITECGVVIHTFDDVEAQYVQILCEKRSMIEDENVLKDGYAIHEIEIYEQNKTVVYKKQFFIPHNNETGYWWQGENARLASLATAFFLAAPLLIDDYTFGADSITAFGMDKVNWVLGMNPFEICQLYSFGTVNHDDYNPRGRSGRSSLDGGICNGITSGENDEKDIAFGTETGVAWKNWRWLEQWLPHEFWYLNAISTINYVVRGDFDVAINKDNSTKSGLKYVKALISKEGKLSIDLSQKLTEDAVIRVIDCKGKILKTETATKGVSSVSLGHSDIASGIYLLDMKIGQQKIINQKIRL